MKIRMDAVIPTARPSRFSSEKNLSRTAFLTRDRK
jgi:hypothetical protein